MSAYNGSGVFTIFGVGLPYVTKTVIDSTVANQLNADLATGLTNCITRDGQSPPTNNIPMGGYKLTGLGAPTALGDALSFANVATVTKLNATVNAAVGRTLEAWGSAIVPVGIGLGGTLYGSTTQATLGIAANLYNDGTNWHNITGDPGTLLSLSGGEAVHYYTAAAAPNSVVTVKEAARFSAVWGGSLLLGNTNPINVGIDASGGQIYTQRGYYTGPSGGMQWDGATFMAGFASDHIQFTVNSGGVRLNANGTSWVSASEQSLKIDIQEIPGDVFEIISGHRPALYRFKNNPTGPLQPGLFYEDATKYYPWAAVDAPQVSHYDELADKEIISPAFRGLSLEQYVPLLMAAFQQQMVINDELHARIKDLEARVAAMEASLPR